MSLTRAAALTDLRGIAQPLNLRMIYLYGYHASPATRTHWRNEVANWLDDVATIRLKPDNRRLSERDYYRHLFDERFGPDLVDNVTAMHRRIQRQKPELGQPVIPDVQIWQQLATFHRAFAKRAASGQPYDDLIPDAAKPTG